MAKDKLMSFLSTSIHPMSNGGSNSSLSVNSNHATLIATGGYPPTTQQQLFHHSSQGSSSSNSNQQPNLPPPYGNQLITSASIDVFASPMQVDLPPNLPQSHSSGEIGQHPNFPSSAAGAIAMVPSPSAMSSNSAVNASSVLNMSHTLHNETDYQDLSLEIERERSEYLEKSKHLQEQLRTLKNEIEELKVDDQLSPLDQLHKEQQEQGDTKYSTIQKVKRGSMQSRVAYFEEL